MMKTPLPEKKLMLPMNVNPASRSARGGSDACRHHYSDSSRRESNGRVEWVCANCDRLVSFETMKGYSQHE